ncbi:MAG: gas vesicle protein [Pseudonocardiaceae bacterium]|nr:gas vesicle protein [Pseudonocardiaceae bacterium]
MSSQDDRTRQRAKTGSAGDGAALGMAEAVRFAVREFSSMTGMAADSVTGARSADGGWSILIDVIELERIPSSTSVLATYRVDINQHGELDSYERLRRYHRGATDPA